jgi:hypothetical protein
MTTALPAAYDYIEKGTPGSNLSGRPFLILKLNQKCDVKFRD